MVDFTANNTAPKHVFTPNNMSVEMYFAEKSKGLTAASTSGWRRGGAMALGAYNVTYETGINQTELGTTKTEQSFHINKQSAMVSGTYQEITPFGQKLINKTDLAQTVTAGAASATVAVGGGGVTTITTQAIGSLVAGMVVGIEIATGTAAYEDFRKIDSVSSNTITLDLPLDEAPPNGADIREIASIEIKRGGVNLQPYSYLGVVSWEDNESRITHFAGDIRITNGNNSYPDAQTAGSTLEFRIIPATETISSKKQPVLMTEKMIF